MCIWGVRNGGRGVDLVERCLPQITRGVSIEDTPPSVTTTARRPGTLSLLQIEVTGQQGPFPYGSELWSSRHISVPVDPSRSSQTGFIYSFCHGDGRRAA